MEDLRHPVELLLLLIWSVGVGYGADLNKWHGWAFVLSGLLAGLLLGFEAAGPVTAVILGVCLGGIVLAFGPIMLRRRRWALGDDVQPEEREHSKKIPGRRS
jgi:hypothetical protein